jgi:hypothetical protein
MKKLLLQSAIAVGLFAISGCSSSSNSSPDADESISGRVADGYLVGATVCLDANINSVCDTGEPTTTTGTGGTYSFDGLTLEEATLHNIVVEIVENVTVDEDFPNETLTKTYTLIAPAGYDFVSPLSTMVSSEVLGGMTLVKAEARLKELLGITTNINDDYIEGKVPSENTNAEVASYTRLHKIAQVTARVMASKNAELEQFSENNGIEKKELIDTIVGEIISNIKSIDEFIHLAPDAAYDADAIATAFEEKYVNIDDANIEDTVQIKNTPTAAANILDLMADGVTWFASYSEGAEDRLAYSTSTVDANGLLSNVTMTKTGAGAWIADPAEAPITDYFIGESGLVTTNDGNLVYSANQDGTYSLFNDDYSITYNTSQRDMAGINIREYISKEEVESDKWNTHLNDTAVFSEGALQISLEQISYTAPSRFALSSFITIPQIATVTAEGAITYDNATTLSGLITTAEQREADIYNINGIKAIKMVGVEGIGGTYFITLNDDKSLSLSKLVGLELILIGESTWGYETIGSTQLLTFKMPKEALGDVHVYAYNALELAFFINANGDMQTAENYFDSEGESTFNFLNDSALQDTLNAYQQFD